MDFPLGKWAPNHLRPNTQNDQLCGMPKWRHEHSWCYGNGSNFDTKKWMVKQIENHHRRLYEGSRFLRRSQLALIPSHKVPAWQGGVAPKQIHWHGSENSTLGFISSFAKDGLSYDKWPLSFSWKLVPTRSKPLSFWVYQQLLAKNGRYVYSQWGV